MDLLKDLQADCGCFYISDLPIQWRLEQKSMAQIIISLTFRGYPLAQWADLCNYLQVPFDEENLKTPIYIRNLFKKYL